MSIILAVILAYTTIGGAVALWLEVEEWRCNTRQALAACVLCGPACWLAVVIVFAVEYVRSR
ncbi:hypothetical protein [uncultured Halomonas sp.]|uniref:hypothetical protein n=1 Tax=uncultured Halomonas sp. TaxID=173971 RepID=UPI0026348F53|nr:hypothetical protein [uncultured Halomonas sp.]